MAGDPVLVNEAWLRQWCAGAVEHLPPPRAYEVAARLKNLAVRWLRPEVLERAAAHARQLGYENAAKQWERVPPLPIESGACWIAVVNKCREELGLLRPAYALPLRWAHGREHDPRLPRGLRELADTVHGELRRLGEVSEPEPWGLLPGSDAILSGLDLSTLDGRWDSGWAPLAMGLLLAAWEGKADAKVWASGSWEPGSGIRPVDGLEPKAELAHGYGAGAFFVPESQAEALREWAQSQCLPLTIGTLRQNTRDLREALGEYLEQHELPIGPGAHLKGKRAEHFRRIQDSETAERFYRKYVLPDVAEDLRQRVPRELLSGDKKLITVVSKGFDLVSLAVQVIQPTACLLLHDRELADEASAAQGWIQRERPSCRAVTCLLEHSTREKLLAAFGRQIEEFAPEGRPEELVFDLTAGKKIMSLALYDAAPVGSYVICTESAFDSQRRRQIPHTERLHAWRVAPKPAA